jgi:hypothetical protein
MKEPKLKNIAFTGSCVVLIAALFVLSGCEPTDWDVILAGPNPVTNVTVDEAAIGLNGDDVSIFITYTTPVLHDVSLYPDANYDVLLTYRKISEAPSPPEYESTRFEYVGPDSQNETRETEILIPEEDLENGGEYIITVYTADGEGQLSEGIDSDPFTASW